ncbi:MAG: phosphoenolpyruvate carboxykinase (GTP) [Chloroflexi bacterium]|nr:MAG: phosphoenolpyruvate carboxykinase (GTP) [Chloroflexota bacterium]
MLELSKGVDILSAIGGVETLDQAKVVFSEKIDKENLAKLAKIKNEEALLKIANAIAMCNPDGVFINTGSAEDYAAIKKMSIEKGEEKALAMKDHTIHYDLPEEQARIVDRTFYIVNPDEDISSLAKKMMRDEAHAYLAEHMKDIMKGKLMLLGFFSRGPVGAAASLPAIQISSSTYVLHSGEILYRNIYSDFDAEAARAGRFLTNIHSEGPNRPEDLPNARVFMDRSWLTTFSTYCTYAGNTLLLKKGNHRFAVDLATYYGQGEMLSEHMFITGIRGTDGKRKTYFAGAAPSGCGKTTTAMVGDDFIGDDLAQIWIADDGTVRAINPEKGIFGIVRDVNWEGDPYLMKCLREEHTEVIYSNVLIKDGVPYWEGSGEETPKEGFNFQGKWTEGMTDANGKVVPISHPNSRATLNCNAIGNYNETDAEDPAGVQIKVITYSGRDADTMPPVWVARNADEGVVIGASIVSAATATEIGVTGVRRQPWANAPFIPGALGDYMNAQFKFFNSNKISDGNRPLMAGLNYFLTHASRGGKGSGLLGEKRDVKVWLGWLERRVNGEADAFETPIGYLPKYEDLKAMFADIDKEYPRELYDMQFSLYLDKLIERIDLQKEAYSSGERIPAKLFEIYDAQRAALVAMKEEYGSIVTPAQLGA